MSKINLSDLMRPKKQPATALATINALEKIIGQKGRWIKGWGHSAKRGSLSRDEIRKGAPVAQMCLMGGVYHVDGPHEDDVTFALALAVAQLYPKKLGARYINGVPLTADEFAKALLRSWESKSDAMRSTALNRHTMENIVIAFNDSTNKNAVLRLIAQARTNLVFLDTAKHMQAEADAATTEANAAREAILTSHKVKK